MPVSNKTEGNFLPSILLHQSRIPKLLCNSGNEPLPFNKQSTLWPSLTCNLKKFSSKQLGNKNDRDDQFGDMVLMVRFSELDNK